MPHHSAHRSSLTRSFRVPLVSMRVSLILMRDPTGPMTCCGRSSTADLHCQFVGGPESPL